MMIKEYTGFLDQQVTEGKKQEDSVKKQKKATNAKKSSDKK